MNPGMIGSVVGSTRMCRVRTAVCTIFSSSRKSNRTPLYNAERKFALARNGKPFDYRLRVSIESTDMNEISDSTQIFQKTTLDNGLRVLSCDMPHTRSVAISIFVKVGSRYEG